MDSPPFIGAWCRKFNPSGIAYVGFWPNFLYQPGTVLNLAVWMLHRNRQAVTFISNNRKCIQNGKEIQRLSAEQIAKITQVDGL